MSRLEVFVLVIIFALLSVIVGSVFVIEQKKVGSKNYPEEGMVSIENYREWLGDEYSGTRFFSRDGLVYAVVTGKPCRTFSSGPVAFIFSPEGLFIDWTRDIGDFPTENLGWLFSQGNVAWRSD